MRNLTSKLICNFHRITTSAPACPDFFRLGNQRISFCLSEKRDGGFQRYHRRLLPVCRHRERKIRKRKNRAAHYRAKCIFMIIANLHGTPCISFRDFLYYRAVYRGKTVMRKAFAHFVQFPLFHIRNHSLLIFHKHEIQIYFILFPAKSPQVSTCIYFVKNINYITVYKARNLLYDADNSTYEPVYKTQVTTYIERILRYTSGDFKEDNIVTFFSNNPSSQKSKWLARKDCVNAIIAEGDSLDFVIDDATGICELTISFNGSSRNLEVQINRLASNK